MKKQYSKWALKALKLAEETARKCSHNYIGTEHILAGLLAVKDSTAGEILTEAGISLKKLLELMEKLVAPSSEVLLEEPQGYTPRSKKVLEKASEEATNMESAEIGTEHILIAMLKETDCVGARLLHTMGAGNQKLYAELMNVMGREGTLTKEEKSATPMLDQYGRDLTEMAAMGKLDPVVGREKEINRIIQILSRRTKNNPCLIGEPGVGKTAITEGLAQKIVSGMVPENMADKRILVLDLSAMVAGSKYRGEFEERIKRVVWEASNDKRILLFLDELHTLIGAGGAEGALDASNILKPSLSRGEIQLIGATTIEEYRKHIEKDPALERRFQPVTVEEPTKEEAEEILRGLVPYYEKHHGVVIEESAVKAAVSMGVRYINDRFLPDKALDLLDEACSKVQISGYKVTDGLTEAELRLRDISEEKERAVKSQDFLLAGKLQEEQKETEEIVEKAHDNNLEVNVYTVNTKEDMKNMIDLKVDAIITNYPNILKDLLK